MKASETYRQLVIRRQPESEELLSLRRQTPNGNRILACDGKLFKFSLEAVVSCPW